MLGIKKRGRTEEEEEDEEEATLLDEEKEKLFKLSEISLHLDTYDDIFSDFDPRPYEQRALSDDLLVELRKACKVKTSGNLEVKFIISQKMKNQATEQIIKRRMKEYFKRHHQLKHKEINSIRYKGIRFMIIGSVISLLATYLAASGLIEESSKLTSFFSHWLLVLLEPAGWFTIWTGLDKILSTNEVKREELNFYEKMLSAEYHFASY